MERTQTASEIAHEYEVMAINSANQHYRLKQQKPYEDFPALARHVSFCTAMHMVWREIADNIELDNGTYDRDGENNNSEWGLM